MVSIIVPIYGVEAYLPRCIESICNQSYPNLQIILVDDESPDKCPEICDKYAQKDNRIVVIHQKNKGVSGARNTGISHATGDYIMFVDSDDELYPHAVETLLNDAQTYGADIVSGTAKLVSLEGEVLTSCEDGECFVYQAEEPLRLSLEGNRYADSACSKLFKTSFIRDIKFVEGKNIHEDGFFIFQCYTEQPLLVQHNVALYQYNVREGSASRQTFSDKYLSMLYFLELKKEIVFSQYPQLIEQFYNTEVRTNLQLLDVLCRTTDKKYRDIQKQCIKTVCALKQYHTPINDHHKLLIWIVTHKLYSVYKFAVRLKYYR